MTLWKGSWRGSQEDSRKKEEGCVQDPEEEKAAEFSSQWGGKVKSIQDSNKPKAGASANLGLTGWGNGDVEWSGVAMTKSWFRPSSATYWMCDLGNLASLCLIISI